MKKFIIIFTLILIGCKSDDSPTSSNEKKNGSPIIESITADKQTLHRGEKTIITVNAIDPDNDILEYSWSINGGGGGIQSFGNTAEFTALSKGNTNIGVVVNDSEGNSTSSGIVMTVEDNQSPRIQSLIADPDTINIGDTSIVSATFDPAFPNPTLIGYAISGHGSLKISNNMAVIVGLGTGEIIVSCNAKGQNGYSTVKSIKIIVE